VCTPGESGEFAQFFVRYLPENLENLQNHTPTAGGYSGGKQKMKTENAEPNRDEMSLGDLIWLYSQDESGDHFYSLLGRLIDTQQSTTAIELLKLRTLNQIHGDLDTIAVEGIGGHIAKLANALDDIDDYGIERRLDA
jgi:hypothetical protein